MQQPYEGGNALQEGRMYCGSHSDKEKRTKVSMREVDHSLWQSAAEENKREGRRGQLICARMSYGGISNQDTRYLRVFPNNKHQERSDGFGCASLSPMRIPIPNEAYSLENFYQGSKKFPQESWEEYLQNRQRMFQDPTPHRHKFARGMKPECSYYVNKNGVMQAYDYLSARYFYCRWYEVQTRSNEDLQRLRAFLAEGTNLMLCGYDSSPSLTTENVWEAYHDLRTPFGHESVIFCLLMLSDTTQYPWNRFYHAHPELQYP